MQPILLVCLKNGLNLPAIQEGREASETNNATMRLGDGGFTDQDENKTEQ